MNRFKQLLDREQVLLLDGGLATELETQGYDINSALWSAALLHSNPQAIVAAHLAYLEAGARCVISASYQASRDGLMSLGLSSEQADDLIASSIRLACQARERFLASHPEHTEALLVAASVGPYGATRHDGSEYTGDYDIDADGLKKFHGERLPVLDRAGADVLACETIPSLLEARVLADLLTEANTPAWISFSCRDETRISDGTDLREAAGLFANHPKVLAVGINCTAPQYIEHLVGEVRQGAPGKAIIVYPNSGERYEAADHSWHGTVEPLECAAAARRWRDAGARIIGGCCRMGPAHIAAIGQQLHDADDSTRPLVQ